MQCHAKKRQLKGNCKGEMPTEKDIRGNEVVNWTFRQIPPEIGKQRKKSGQ